MLEFDPAVRSTLAAARSERLRTDWGRERRSFGLRRRVGLRLVSLGLRLAEPCLEGARSAA